MKRIIFCFDGTWNRIDSKHPTNVLLMASSIAPIDDEGISQIVHYDNGVGTNWYDKRIGGAMGVGLLKNIRQAYQFLIFNYNEGDEVYAFGFSRGAFTARSFVGFIRSAGIIERHYSQHIEKAVDLYKGREFTDDLKKLDFRAKYSRHISVSHEDDSYRCETYPNEYKHGQAHPFQFRYLGLWDTVETLGIRKVIHPWKPFGLGKKPYTAPGHRYHNHQLSGMVAAGRHAVALDEGRRNFDVEPWGNLEKYNAKFNFPFDHHNPNFQEKFFPGTHGSVGGGGYHTGLSDGAMSWVMAGASETGLKFDDDPEALHYQLAPNFRDPIDNIKKGEAGFFSKILRKTSRPRSHRPQNLRDVYLSAQYRWAYQGLLPEGKPYRPETLRAPLEEELNALPSIQRQ